MICRYCHEPFTARPNKPGMIDVCYDTDCQCRDHKEHKEPEKLMAEVSWEGKQTPIANVTTAKKARAFNQAQRRFGASVLRCTLPTRERPSEGEWDTLRRCPEA